MFGMFIKGEGRNLRERVEYALERGWICPIKENVHSDSDYYTISRGEIVIRGREKFLDDEEYFGTLTHLMAHSVRGFDGDPILNSDDYIKEELICEYTSAMLMSMMGMEKSLNDDSCFYKKVSEKYWNKDPEREELEESVKERLFSVLKALSVK